MSEHSLSMTNQSRHESDSPVRRIRRRAGRGMVHTLSFALIASLLSVTTSQALPFNPVPEAEYEPWIQGNEVGAETAVQDGTVADAAIETLPQAQWPEPETVVLGGTGAPEASAFSSMAEEDSIVGIGTVSQKVLDDWNAPFSSNEAAPDQARETAPAGYRLPSEPTPPPEEATPTAPDGGAPEERTESEAEPSAPDRETGTDEATEESTEADRGPEEPPTDGASPEPEAEDRPDPRVVESAEVELLSRADAEEAGVDGVLMRVRRTDGVDGAGPVEIVLDYSGFASAFGGDYGSRLRLLALADCETGGGTESDDCTRAYDLGSVNDPAADTLTVVAPATASGVTLMAAADADSGNGDYQASDLAPSAAWDVSLQSGSFSWTYPIQAPGVAADLAPDVSLAYSSGAVDGRTASTNNQASWIGEGFDYHPGFIERSYIGCAQDGQEDPDKTGDLCWKRHNATLSLNGMSSELLLDSDGTWRLRDDDNSTVERLTGTTNGDNDGEYWKVTTSDGTQYFFGRNRLPGWTSGDPETGSAWTVPVFGNDSSEPCHDTSFADSWCQQAWRWNLDYVVDAQGNVMTLYYDEERNHYGRNMEADDATGYDRGGHLDRIEYGLRSDDVFATAPARVDFDVTERCVPTDSFDCAESDRDEDNADHWPDVPLDQVCESGDECTDQFSPTFFTTKRLTGISTQVHDGSDYTTVDSWEFAHAFPDPGDGTDPTLWLDSITHTGHVDGTLATPPVTFGGTPLPNRVDATSDGVAPLNKWRITSVHTETGGQLDVSYSAPGCTAGSAPTPHTNTQRCFPVKWVPSGQGDDDITDWFHKYVVVQVQEMDLVTDQPAVITDYDYVGDAAWRYMDADGFIEDDKRTWSQWRGYDTVRVTTGAEGGTQSVTEHRFFRGMHGDHLPDGERSITLTDSEGGEHTDHDHYAGRPLETTAFNGPGGEVLEKKITVPWSRETGSRTYSWGTLRAHQVDAQSVRTYTPLANGGWRQHRVDTTYDAYALPVEIDDWGDTAVIGDETCTRTTFNRNTAHNLLVTVSREEIVSVPCGQTPSRPDDVVSDLRTAFDGQAMGEPPVQGLETSHQRLTGYENGEPVYQTTGTASFDTYGRKLTQADAEDNTTTTEYTDAVPGGNAVEVTTTNPAGHTNTVEIAPGRSATLAETDANGKRTELAYDPLGRLTDVWLPNRDRDLDTPSMRFEYHMSKDAPTYVVTSTLNPHGDYTTTYRIHDGWLRLRQTQSPSYTGEGRVISDVLHDSRGLEVQTRQAYPAEGDPGGDLFVANNTDLIPRYTETVYDGAERPVHEIQMSAGEEVYRTSTAYVGEQTKVTAPEGGTGTTTVSDLYGNTVELRHHHGRQPSGDYDAIHYTYTRNNELETVTDSAGNEWSYTYDINSRKVSATDPDSGTTTYTYDGLDRMTTRTDARGQTLAYAYDDLGRTVALHDDSLNGPVRAAWTYDTLELGQLTSSTRYDDGLAYTNRVLSYDDLYQVEASTVTIPQEETGLGGTYRFITRYNVDGSVNRQVVPSGGGLYQEVVNYTRDDLGQVTAIAGEGTYLRDAHYSQIGNLVQRLLGRTESTDDLTWQDWDYDPATDRLTESLVARHFGSGSLRHQFYDYDDAGNILSIRDEPTEQNHASDVQCFTYDHLRQLTEAWTPDATGPGACDAAPSTGSLGGPASYWHTYTYDEVGNRVTETQHGGIGGATERTYTHPQAGQDHPHAVTEVYETGPAGDRLEQYDFDESGNMVSRVTPLHDQVLEWDAEGHLTRVADTDRGVTSYVYDADGTRLIRRDATTSTLYLPGMEIHFERDTLISRALRFYTHDGDAIAVRDSDHSVHWLFSDHHGTGELAVDATTGETVHRRFTPFGTDRSTGVNEWPSETGFVGGTIDASTGLTQIGARAYDADLGRFVSVDPVLDLTDPQQMHGYMYANSNPVTFSDPDGRWVKKKIGRPRTKVKKRVSGASGRRNQPSRVNWGGVTTTARGVSTTVNRGGRGSGRGSGSQASAVWRDTPYAGAVEFGAGMMMGLKQHSILLWGTDYAMGHFGLGMEDLNALAGIDPNSDAYGYGNLAGTYVPDIVTEIATGPIPAGTASRLLRNGAGSVGNWLSRLRRGGCHSFIPGTLVLMADGSTRPIEDLEVGDEVLATDPETGEQGAREVLATIVGSGAKTLVEVTVDTTTQVDASELETPDGLDDVVAGLPGPTVLGDVVVATDEHPFWVPELERWVDAIDLAPGMWLLSSEGTLVQVRGVQAWTQPATVHNLTIQGVHTYHVSAEGIDILSHNAGGAWCNTNKPVSGMRPDRGQTSLYAIVNQVQGKILKWGISDNPVVRYTRSEYDAWGAQYGGNYGMQILRNFDSRDDALSAERYLTERVPGPENFEPHAGSRGGGSGGWQDVLRDVQRGIFGGRSAT
ncbi:RHS repeat-associated core domain-containing protein [Nocardiopsis sp. LOL_012]|uniref:RHS repeat-associated core domain-containing protein n=1 Tax=Nocardiopsis sp. LOL_012 TaxID=3345409 RepID=UPI003A891840